MDFLVGTLTGSGAGTGLIFQDCQANIEFDSAEVKDENGNVAYIQHYNHRAVISANAVAAKDAAQPSAGATIQMKGIELPTPDATGKMTNPTIKILKDADAATPIDFLVTSASLSTSNSDVCKYSLTLTRYLENGLGGIKTSNS